MVDDVQVPDVEDELVEIWIIFVRQDRPTVFASLSLDPEALKGETGYDNIHFRLRKDLEGVELVLITNFVFVKYEIMFDQGVQVSKVVLLFLAEFGILEGLRDHNLIRLFVCIVSIVKLQSSAGENLILKVLDWRPSIPLISILNGKFLIVGPFIREPLDKLFELGLHFSDNFYTDFL
jgi:hypothetical protein